MQQLLRQLISHHLVQYDSDSVLDLLLHEVHGCDQRLRIRLVRGLARRCHELEHVVPPRFLVIAEQGLVSRVLELLALALNGHVVELALPLLLALSAHEVEQVDSLVLYELGLAVVISFLRYLLDSHLSDLVHELPLVLDVVVLNGGFIAPVEDDIHRGVLITGSVFDAEYLLGVWLEGLEELDVALLQLLVLEGDQLVLGDRFT